MGGISWGVALPALTEGVVVTLGSVTVVVKELLLVTASKVDGVVGF